MGKMLDDIQAKIRAMSPEERKAERENSAEADAKRMRSMDSSSKKNEYIINAQSRAMGDDMRAKILKSLNALNYGGKLSGDADADAEAKRAEAHAKQYGWDAIGFKRDGGKVEYPFS